MDNVPEPVTVRHHRNIHHHGLLQDRQVFIIEFIRISNRRMDLTKVSIVAQDVSDASTQGLDFTDEDVYELNTKLKMDVLKSHLKGYVADDYEYDIDVTLWERFKKAVTKKRDAAKRAAS